MNKSIKLIIVLFLVTFSSIALLAQKTQVYTNRLQDFEKAKMLYTKEQVHVLEGTTVLEKRHPC